MQPIPLVLYMQSATIIKYDVIFLRPSTSPAPFLDCDSQIFNELTTRLGIVKNIDIHWEILFTFRVFFTRVIQLFAFLSVSLPLLRVFYTSAFLHIEK